MIDGARHATAGFVVASALALVLAVRLPLDVVVFGVLVLGVAHLGYEVRYMTGRYRGLLHGRVLIGVSAALVAIVLGRLVVHGTWWAAAEIAVLAAMLIGVVATTVAEPRRRAAGIALVSAAAAFALLHPASWFVAQAWLHNLVPAVFLWQWSSPLAIRQRRAFRSVTALWLVAIPVALLAGAFDAWMQAGSSVADSIATSAGVRSSVVPTGFADGDPAAVLAGATTASRLIAAFAFLQLLHYTVWLWHFPRADRGATRVFEATPVGAVLRSWRLPSMLLAVSALLGLVAWLDYRSGRGLYTSIAAYHAYLEYPVLIALALRLPIDRAARSASPQPPSLPTSPVVPAGAVR
jgi:hypothetical protein